jgi:hypothetical protein
MTSRLLQYRAFRRYRDLDVSRRTARAAFDVPVGRRVPGCFERWATRFEWRRRAAAWDDELYRAIDAARLAAVKRATARG